MIANHELFVVATAAAPFAEVDAAIPLAISFGFTPLKAYLVAVLGNWIPLLPLLWFWPVASNLLARHWPWFKRLLDWVFAHTRARYGARIEKTGLLAIVILLTLPIPFAGAWTMTVLSFIYNLPFWKSFYAIVLGVAAGALVVLAITVGAVHFF